MKTIPTIKMVCYTCGGKGWYWVYKDVICGYCAGTGRNTKSNLWALPCNRCSGKGTDTELVKEECNCTDR